MEPLQSMTSSSARECSSRRRSDSIRTGSALTAAGMTAEIATGWDDVAAPEFDLLLVLGGDGTYLRAVQAIAESGLNVPILGINHGVLGFLTAAEAPADANDARESDALAARVAASLAEGRYEVVGRLLLTYTATLLGAPVSSGIAANEVTVGTSEFGRMVEIEARANGERLTVFSADGVVIATPTGSTAYSLSAGGPVMHPDLAAISVTALAPHSLAARPIVVPADTSITLSEARGAGLLLACDGHPPVTIPPRTIIEVQRAPWFLQQALLPDSPGFYERLRRKLRWDGSVRGSG
jgi:NAD+ kinase